MLALDECLLNLNMEEFFHNHQHTFAAFGDIGSFLGAIFTAVVSWLAIRGHKPKIRAELKIEHYSMILDVCDLIVVNITNLDPMPVRVPHDSFKIKYGLDEFLYPFDRRWDDDPCHPWYDYIFLQIFSLHKCKNVPDDYISDPVKPKYYPILIEPRDSKSFYLATSKLLEANKVPSNLFSFWLDDYVQSFAKAGRMQRFFFGMGCFWFYRPKIMLYNKSYTIALSKELKAKIKAAVKAGGGVK